MVLAQACYSFWKLPLYFVQEWFYKFNISPCCESSCGSSSLMLAYILFHTNHNGATSFHYELAGVSLSCKIVWKIAHTLGTGMVFDQCELFCAC